MAETTKTGTAGAISDDAAAAETQPAQIAPATSFTPAGAPVQEVPDVDPTHPAVDANPRAYTSVADNAISFNDPTISGAEQVAQRMEGQKFDLPDGTPAPPKPQA